MSKEAERYRLFSPATRAVYLMKVEAFKDLDPEDLAALARLSRLRYFRKDALLFPPDGPPASFHIIVRGEVETDGREQPEPVVPGGGAVGFLTVLARTSRRLDARARTGVLTLEIDSGELFDLLESSFGILHRLIAGLCRRILVAGPSAEPPPDPDPVLEALPRHEGGIGLLERALHLRRSLRLRDTHPDTLIEAADRLEEARVEAGAVLWTIGEFSSHMDVLVEGEVVSQREEAKGETYVPGALLGHLEALAGMPRPNRMVAQSPAVLLRLSTEYALDLLEDHFGLTFDVLSGLAARLLWEYRGEGERPQVSG